MLCSPSHSLSSSQNGDETGTWPNNQFDTEMLQAMILASASGEWCGGGEEWDGVGGGRPGVLGPPTAATPGGWLSTCTVSVDLSAGLRGPVAVGHKCRLRAS